MKKIKIAPLTDIDSLQLKVDTEKKVAIDDPSKLKDLHEKLNAIVAEFRVKGKGIIVGQSIEGKVAVSTQIKLEDNKSYFLPEPNPVHLFFSNAVEHFEKAKLLRKEINQTDQDNSQTLFITFNNFFNEITTGLIILYTSTEAFINQQIPENYVFQIKGKEYLKKDIEWMDIKEKIKDFLPIIFKIKFQVTNTKEYQEILKIGKIRNDLIHLKTQLSINRTFYEKLFSDLLNLNTDNIVDSVFIFMNIIRPNYLTEEKS